jgi:hypothetical protein
VVHNGRVEPAPTMQDGAGPSHPCCAGARLALTGCAGCCLAALRFCLSYMQGREVPSAAPLCLKRTGTGQCWWFALLSHTRAQSVRAKVHLWRLLWPGQQTYCAIGKIEHGGDGHFQAKAAVPCSTSCGGFMPDQPQTQSSNYCKHYRR